MITINYNKGIIFGVISKQLVKYLNSKSYLWFSYPEN